MINIILAQLNYTVGDIDGNIGLMQQAYAHAASEDADLVVFSELCITGYPPEDLVFRPGFQQQAIAAVRQLATLTGEGKAAILCGGIWRDADMPGPERPQVGQFERQLFNAGFLLDGGDIAAIFRKYLLPNYDVFDEKRTFDTGGLSDVVEWRGIRLGVLLCADMWSDEVLQHMQAQQPELVVSLNGSPYTHGKRQKRYDAAQVVSSRLGAPLIYVNQVGGQDELVFDGASFVMHPESENAPHYSLPAWQVQQSQLEWAKGDAGWRCVSGYDKADYSQEEETYSALITGIRDYVHKNGFPGVLIGLSGGIDSALVAAIATDALGADAVQAVMLPSRYTSQDSLDDAAGCADALGTSLETLPIEAAVQALDGILAESFQGTSADTTEENMQSRIRATLLMALSNKRGHMLLTTGNKSEMAVGYATLYGDMCGGYNPLKDIYKTEVYALARWRNAHTPTIGKGPKGEVIPQRILTKAPSAELRHDQTDQDSLPPYDQLDWILERLIEDELSVEAIAAQMPDAITPEVVAHVTRLLYLSEYKRRQAPPGTKVTRMAFGRDRRYPITNRYRSGG